MRALAWRPATAMMPRVLVALALTSATMVVAVAAAPVALAAGTTLFNQPFHDNTVDGSAGSVSVPSGTNAACLTAAGNATANPLASCPAPNDAQGSGALRLTPNSGGKVGSIFATSSFPTSQGLDARFNTYQYGTAVPGADGLGFVVAAVNPANPATPTSTGPSGGSLGYSAFSTQSGMPDGYLGVGLDAFGNYSNGKGGFEGSGCTDPPNITSRMPGQVVIRGPGNGTVGYCAVQSSAATATSPALALTGTTRAGSLVPVEVVINPTSSALTTASGLVVPAGNYEVAFTPIGGSARTLTGALPVVPSGLYPASWVNANGIPKQLAFGWLGSTGSVTDTHEIDNAVVTSLNPVPTLAVSQTSYAATTTSGSPVSYVVSASSAGVSELFPVTVTETVPAGLLPVSATGTGWVCGAPSGQQISCTNSTSPFTGGTITVNAVVGNSSVSPTLIQTASSVVASSSDAAPAMSSSAPAGTVPAAPVVTSLSPTNGAAGGGNAVTITGSNLSGATAIEIGTVGEFHAAAPTTLKLCSAPAAGCFTITSSTSIAISSMPAHAAGAVQVSVVSLGIAGSVSYTYNAGPALLFAAPPGGEVNVAYSDQLTVTGGTSPFTWSTSSGSLPPGITLGASTGLLAGTPTTAGTYSFTVKVTDSAGLSDTEPVSLTIVAGPSMTFGPPPAGWTNTVYSYQLTATGGITPYTWSLASGALPPGILLSPAGTLSGTSTATGSYGFTVKVADANGQAASQATSIVIGQGVSTTFSAPPGAVVGVAYSDPLTATGGTAPYTWSVNTGTLPPGITLSTAGVLAGTPTTAGSYPFTVNVVDQNNGIATASITLVVTTAGLTIALSADTASTTPGSVVHYTITVTNSGQTAFTGATFAASLSGLLDDATYNANAVATSGSVSFSSPNLTWTGNLAVGAVATVTYSVTVKNPDPGDKVLLTTVTSATTGSNCPAGGSDSRCSSSVTVLVPGLTIAASAGGGSTAPGSVVSYTVTVTNSGQTSYTGATFTDALAGVLDDATYNSNASATAGSVSFASPNLTWTGSLAVGAVATITFSVTVKNPDTGDGTLSSTVTSATAGSNCAAGSGDARCTVTVKVAVLAIVNSSNVASTTPGGVVRFTATFTNTGQVPYNGITIATDATDVFDDAVPNGDQTATSGSLAISGNGVTWTGDIPVGGSVTVTGTVTVKNPDPGNKLLASTITTSAAGSNCPSGTTDPSCSVSVPVLVPGLTLTQAANATFAVPGQKVTYTVTIANTGQTAYAGISVAESVAGSLDDAAYGNDASVTAGSVSYAAGVITWTGSLAAGASAVLTYSLTVNNPDTGDKLLISALASAATGSNCPTSASAGCTLTIAVLTPALTITKTAGTATATPGQVITYTITVTNTGQIPYAGASFTDDLSSVLDDAAYNADASATAGTVTYTSPDLTWTGDLAVGATATITYTVTVSNPDTGDTTLTNTVTSPTPGSNCPATGGDSRCTVTITLVGAATLTFTVASDVSSVTAGGTVTYTITAANSGLSSRLARFTQPLAGVLDDAAYNNNATATIGTVTFTSPNLTWTGRIPATSSVTITYTVTVSTPDTGNMILASTLTSTSAGSNCPAASTDPRCASAVTVSSLTITAGANVTTTTPGGIVTFTTTFTNTGQTPYTGITINITSPPGPPNATSNGDQTATSGTIIVTATGATWTGDIPVGATITVSGSATVSNPNPGSPTLSITYVTTAPGSNCPPTSTNPACTVNIPILTPALTITKTASVSTTTPGSVVGYTIVIDNTGGTSYSGAAVTDDLSGVLDDATLNSGAAATIGSVSYASPVLTWTGDLMAGQEAVVTYSVTIDSPDTSGDKDMSNTALSSATGSTCPPGSPASACTAEVVVLTPALTITKTASVATVNPGSKVGYTITIANTGQTAYSPATVTDDLTNVLNDASYDNDAAVGTGTLSYTAPTLTWSGTLAPGATATITYTVTVSNPDTGDRVLTNTAISSAPGSTCPPASPGSACTATTSVVAGTLSITVPVTAAIGSAAPGDTLTSSFGTVQVTDSRGFGANWTATVSSSAFVTGTGAGPQTIPAADVSYLISALTDTGQASFSFSPVVTLSGTPQAVVGATNVEGNTTASWDPQISVRIPPSAIAGDYTATITHSVS
jgi:large repetitive protein